MTESDSDLFASLDVVSEIQVSKRAGVRYLKCFCGFQSRQSILPHIRKQHPELWDSWKLLFIELRNRKWTYLEIMNLFRVNEKPLFSWTVIEKEMLRIEELNGEKLKVWEKDKIGKWEPEGFIEERTTVWSFLRRGKWAVHQNDYRGNWPPQLVRNLLLKYTQEGDWVADIFVGGGTTLIESWLTRRKSIGIDINNLSIKMTRGRLNELESKSKDTPKFDLDTSFKPIVVRGDSRQVNEILPRHGFKHEQISLVCAHPPYLDAVQYSLDEKADLSRIKDVNQFCAAMRDIAQKTMSWLKDDGIFALLIADTRRNSELIPLGHMVLTEMLEAGYILKEIIIKPQNRDQLKYFWTNNANLGFLIAHEYLFIFKKQGRM